MAPLKYLSGNSLTAQIYLPVTLLMRASDSAGRTPRIGSVDRVGTYHEWTDEEGRPPRGGRDDVVRQHARAGGDGLLEFDSGRRRQGPRPAVAADGGDLALRGDGRRRDRPLSP